MSPRLDVQLDGGAFVPGDAVRGTIRVLEGGASRFVEASLEFHEDSGDYGSVASSVSTGPLHEGDLVAGSTLAFMLTVPMDALPNYRSEHGKLYWEVHARSDELGRDTHARQRIIVRRPPRSPEA